ncbi:BNR repeat-like domain-containing protein [Cyclobacterium lianum]|uniref:BNR repeat-like domain-containing protein n=1 Tax=Cyclobacterium lianum TaxID=388280 RepID=A0A1M7JME1_9BACT|nr:sialidase family protein [Cyclobacterium lianum]SHM53687.1 BNR repeat-like domain-containing protein [Cyclobacterium lianum]
MKKNRLFVFVGFFLINIVNPSLAQELLNPSQVVLHIGKEGANPRNSEGSFIQLNDGRILFAYSKFEGGSGDHASAFIAGRYSSDGGNTWTKKDEVIVSNEGGMNVMSVSFLRLQDGSIALFYARKNSLDDCTPYMRISHDEAVTWSEPVSIISDTEGYFVLNNDRVIQLPGGRLLAPVSLHKVAGKDFSMRGRIYCYYSDDSGETWQRSMELPNPKEVVLQEPGLVSLKTGTIKMWLRTDRGVQYLSESHDNGNTWQEVYASDIPSPRSPASLRRIPKTGDLLLIWNNNDGSIDGKASFRTPLTAAVSKDEGNSWIHIKELENDPDGFFCYTAISFLDDEVLLGYMAANRLELKEKIPLVLRKMSLHEFYE